MTLTTMAAVLRATTTTTKVAVAAVKVAAAGAVPLELTAKRVAQAGPYSLVQMDLTLSRKLNVVE